MKLPTELRLRVYSFLFEGLELYYMPRRDGNSKLRVPGILGVCREIRLEAIEILHETAVINATIDEGGIAICNDVLAQVPTYARISDFEGCCAFVRPLYIDFRKIKKLSVTIANVIRYDWDDAADTIDSVDFMLDDEEDMIGYTEWTANRAYNIRQSVQNLVTCLRLMTRVQHITVELVYCEEAETTWILEPFATLRNLKTVDIEVDAEDTRAVAKLVTLMKGNSVLRSCALAEKMGNDYAALADFMRQFNLDEQGSWADKARELLFRARVASSELRKADFKKHRQAILAVWQRELK